MGRKNNRKTQLNIQITNLSDKAYAYVTYLADQRKLSAKFREWAEREVQQQEASSDDVVNQQKQQIEALQKQIATLSQQIEQMVKQQAFVSEKIKVSESRSNQAESPPLNVWKSPLLQPSTPKQVPRSQVDEDTDYDY
jgi:phage-related minor tail protein